MPTIEEIRTDLRRTEDDISRLTAIVAHLRSFIYNTDQDRSALRTDLLKYEVLLEHAKALKAKITEAMDKLRFHTEC